MGFYILQSSLKLVPLNKILVHEGVLKKPSLTDIQKKKNIIRQNRDLQTPMIVEKKFESDKFLLIAGYPEYLAYTSLNKEAAWCFVRKQSTREPQLFTKLERLFDTRSRWIDRYETIEELRSLGNTPFQVARYLGIPLSVLNKYMLDDDIPTWINEMAVEHEATTHIKRIKGLKINAQTKMFLYEKAVMFPKRRPERLNIQQINMIQLMLENIPVEFNSLPSETQSILLEQCFNYKEVLIEKFYQIVEDNVVK